MARGCGPTPVVAGWLPLLAVALAAVVAAQGSNDVTSVDGHALPAWCHYLFSGAAVGVGLLECFVGYRLFKVTLFMLGFLVPAGVLFLLVFDHWDDPAAVWVALAAGVVVGSGVAILGWRVPKIGVFLIGAALGVVTGMLITAFGLGKVWPSAATIIEGVSAGVLGLGFGVLAVFFVRIVVVVATSTVGGALFVVGLGNFLPPAAQFPHLFSLADNPVTGPAYGWFGAIGAFAAAGLFVQFHYTAPRTTAGAAEKDEWQKRVDGSTISLHALIGRRKEQGRVKGRKGKGRKGRRVSDAPRSKAEALLQEDEYGYDDGEYHDAGGDWGDGCYYDDEQGYTARGYGNHDYEHTEGYGDYEMSMSTPPKGGRGHGAPPMSPPWSGRYTSPPVPSSPSVRRHSSARSVNTAYETGGRVDESGAGRRLSSASARAASAYVVPPPPPPHTTRSRRTSNASARVLASPAGGGGGAPISRSRRTSLTVSGPPPMMAYPMDDGGGYASASHGYDDDGDATRISVGGGGGRSLRRTSATPSRAGGSSRRGSWGDGGGGGSGHTAPPASSRRLSRGNSMVSVSGGGSKRSVW